MVDARNCKGYSKINSLRRVRFVEFKQLFSVYALTWYFVRSVHCGNPALPLLLSLAEVGLAAAIALRRSTCGMTG